MTSDTCQNCGTYCGHGAQQWQPIETAPKDGTRVLLALHDGMVVTGRWSFVGATATHWMPLLEAPK